MLKVCLATGFLAFDVSFNGREAGTSDPSADSLAFGIGMGLEVGLATGVWKIVAISLEGTISSIVSIVHEVVESGRREPASCPKPQ